MRICLRASTNILTVGLLLAGEATLAGAQDNSDGELHIYDMMTENGTAARREFRDAAGRLTKTIYYSARWPTSGPISTAPHAAADRSHDTGRSASAPAGIAIRAHGGRITPDSLVITSINTYDYDRRGRRVRSNSYAPDGALLGFATSRYRADGSLEALTNFTDGGRRRHETRYEGPKESRRSVAHLDFDESGQRLIVARGRPITDLEPAYRWGPQRYGLRCGVVPYKESTRLVEMRIAIAIKRATKRSSPFGIVLPQVRYRPVLHDASGALIPPARAAARKESERVAQPIEQLMYKHREYLQDRVGHWRTFELFDWYPELEPGTYSCYVELRDADEKYRVISNTIWITIE